MSQVNNTELLARGLRTEFVDTYARAIKDAEAQLSKVMELGIPSNKNAELYGYIESAPAWKIWPRGEDIPRNAMRSRSYQVVNYDWAITIDWHENDEEDDQSLSLTRRVREAATGGALLKERVFFQMITGATDANLLPVVPTCPDGAALFATTASSVNRFGASSGNLLTGNGVSSTAAIQQDFFSAWSQFKAFDDTQGQPLWPSETIGRGLTIIYGSANEQVFRQAFSQIFNSIGSTAPSNVIMDSRLVPDLWSTQRITDGDWFVFLNGAPIKAVFEQVRRPPRDNMEDMLNSDLARRTKNKAMSWDARFGFGANLPIQAVKINN